MNNSNKSFDKYYVKKNPANGDIIIGEDEKPLLGECAKKDCRIEDRHAKILNRGWKNSGVYFIESKEQSERINKMKEDESINTDIKGNYEKLKSEAASKDDEIEKLKAMLSEKKESANNRLLLEGEAAKLNIKFRSDISDEKLEEKINEAKNN